MRSSIAALALIRRTHRGRTEWLTQWNETWGRFNLIGGHKRPTESFRACAVRELEEELHLQAETDFRVAAEPFAHLEYTAWSASARAETDYTIELFETEFLTTEAAERVLCDEQNRWLSEAEIEAGRCADGRPISETVPLLLRKSGLLPHGARTA